MKTVLALTIVLSLLMSAVGVPATGTGRVYVSNEKDNSISVLDRRTNKVMATIAVGRRPRDLKLSQDKRYLYVSPSGSSCTRRWSL